MTLTRLVAALPAFIRVGPYNMHLVPMDENHADLAEAFGYFKRKDQIIAFDADHKSPESLVDTLIHEVGHAIWWAYGISDDDKEERIVSIQATAWTQIFKDNPWLSDWIKKALR